LQIDIGISTVEENKDETVTENENNENEIETDTEIPDNAEHIVEKQEDSEEIKDENEDDWQTVKDGRHTLSYQPKPEAQTRSGRVYKHYAAVAQANLNINP
jgi:hypothetical protein